MLQILCKCNYKTECLKTKSYCNSLHQHALLWIIHGGKACAGKSPSNSSATQWMRRRCRLSHMSVLDYQSWFVKRSDMTIWPDQWISLPCPVPEKYQLYQWVREIHQTILGYTGDPQPVVQYVQVHIPGCEQFLSTALFLHAAEKTPS